MNKEIKYNNTLIGLPAEIFKIKPPRIDEFNYATELDLLDEPNNIIESLQSIIKRLTAVFIPENAT